ncbi:MAG TPA: hypothetical protein VGK74_27760 [Symbiobacteriaceae bacterium]|jgi:hypothetical protein
MLATETINCWIEQRRAEGYSPDTLRTYRLQMSLLVQVTGDAPVDSITLDDLRGDIAGPQSTSRKASTIGTG